MIHFLNTDNEELIDLLNPQTERKLKLMEDMKKGVVCQGLEELSVINLQEVHDLLVRGINMRVTAATTKNAVSSRSHTIFTIRVMVKESQPDGDEVVRNGQFNLVDLAG